MTIKEAMMYGTLELTKAKILSSYLDSLLLLCHILNKPKEYIFINSNKKISVYKIARFKKLIARRKKREPVSYIIDKKEFWSMDFVVNKHVPIPYPETEDLIEKCLKINLFDFKDRLFEKLLYKDVIISLLHNKFGNYS